MTPTEIDGLVSVQVRGVPPVHPETFYGRYSRRDQGREKMNSTKNDPSKPMTTTEVCDEVEVLMWLAMDEDNVWDLQRAETIRSAIRERAKALLLRLKKDRLEKARLHHSSLNEKDIVTLELENLLRAVYTTVWCWAVEKSRFAAVDWKASLEDLTKAYQAYANSFRKGENAK